MVVTKMHILGNICQRARHSYSGAEYGSLDASCSEPVHRSVIFSCLPRSVLYRSTNFLLSLLHGIT
jgi:hypothetical protein